MAVVRRRFPARFKIPHQYASLLSQLFVFPFTPFELTYYLRASLEQTTALFSLVPMVLSSPLCISRFHFWRLIFTLGPLPSPTPSILLRSPH